MPRLNPGRQRDQEQWVATRLKNERVARGWSLEKVAKAMAEVGCPLPVSAIHKIEKSDPPRKISVNEFLAFSEVFGIPMNDLVQPPQLADDAEAISLVAELRAAEEEVQKALAIYVDLQHRLRTLRGDVSDELYPGWPDVRLSTGSGQAIFIDVKTLMSNLYGEPGEARRAAWAAPRTRPERPRSALGDDPRI